ncbi:hypothetical protein IGI65_000189 [Enterococcus sp. DIV0755b]|uniref:anti sigma factor C-terminal domain-containing protein n=1 Tax=Enterococcus sp. DIV0755b TaxID=2774657 RepID=UPI003F2243AD
MKPQNFDFEKIQKNIKKKNQRKNLLIVVMTVLLTLCLFWSVPKVLNQFFYNPAGKNTYLANNQYLFTRQIYNELTLPSYTMTDLTIDQTGIGSYQIKETYSPKYSNEVVGFQGLEITRNKRHYDNNFYPISPIFSQELATKKTASADNNLAKSNLLENIKVLPKSTYVTVDLAFKEDKSIPEYSDWLNETTTGADTLWQAVRPPQNAITPNKTPTVVGYAPTGSFSGISVTVTNEKKLNEDFPLLIGYLANDKQNNWPEEKRQTTHFKSLLNYLIENEDFLAQDAHLLQKTTLQNILQAVETNGIKIYGVTLRLPAFELEKILQNEVIKTAYITQLDVFPLTSQSAQLPGFHYPTEK